VNLHAAASQAVGQPALFPEHDERAKPRGVEAVGERLELTIRTVPAGGGVEEEDRVGQAR
jgi:hypothetical protein